MRLSSSVPVVLQGLVLLSSFSRGDDEAFVRETTLGRIQGKVSKTLEDKEYLSFLGIPYAEAPVGHLRFKRPQPAKPWNGIFDGREEGPVCLQIPSFSEAGVVGDENCLSLSIFTPNLMADQAAKPVIVWIHGGRFLVGSASTNMYGPDYLIDQDVVVVNIQYRLGVFGFLSTEDEVAPGNYGLHDQTMALQWIRDNIRQFGGDPNQVTVMGHSAGGASSHSHLISPRSKGLFKNIIALSGTSNMGWASRFTFHDKVAVRQAKLFDCPTEPSQALVDCLRKVDAKELAASISDLHVFFKRTLAKIPLTPYTSRFDPESDSPFFPVDPREALRTGQYDRSVPLLVGTTSQEGSWYMSTWYSKIFAQRLKEIDILNQEELVNFVAGEDLLRPGDWSKIVKHYFRNGKIADPSNRIAGSNFFSDITFNYETLHAAHLHTRSSDSPVYLYRFDYIGGWGYVSLFNETAQSFGGVAHLDDIRYLMRLPWAAPLSTAEDKDMSKRFAGFMANFAKYGNPSSKTETWEPYVKGSGQYYKIASPDSSGMVRDIPFPKDRMNFIKIIYDAQEDITIDFKVNDAKEEL
ncbi:hypothetical protein TCAL_11403 [Tigriopus californicus]|uniref:Carboxylic ester hydrolase n=2 Tax=Tigriopus californicus TaxID=6832 RepID=A0A553PFP3_TIGCA|nr:hypothetical protein TCAL_11403 [Tigriopus californicus]|eukprot:TCALIF_11403-PA protein Name:"Similar to Esterase FE4 (Myzus persicae)" AED:0.01 eAED:0.01 QI:14/1/1/1/0.66/0.5/4/120/577